MSRLNYISNLDLGEASGGWTGVNVALHRELSRKFSLHYVGPINPGSDLRQKLVSKLRRTAGLPGSFHFFSDRRLRQIASLVEESSDSSADCDFFHGSTPWILYRSSRPYFAYADTCFSTYVNVYHDRSEFLAKDLERVFQAEASWLENASGVFFGTGWAREQVVKDYKISERNLYVVGAGGGMTVPAKDTYEGGKDFLFVAFDFEKKGGRICAEAFSLVHSRFPEARMRFVGARPPDEVLAQTGVEYVGFLNKSVPAELERLEQLYAKAFALIHPTSSDIQPLVISETGYFGCPAIAAKSFGIPELVRDGETGFLIETPLTPHAFAERMSELLSNQPRYLQMRKAVREHTTTAQTWQSVADQISSAMEGRVN